MVKLLPIPDENTFSAYHYVIPNRAVNVSESAQAGHYIYYESKGGTTDQFIIESVQPLCICDEEEKVREMKRAESLAQVSGSRRDVIGHGQPPFFPTGDLIKDMVFPDPNPIPTLKEEDIKKLQMKFEIERGYNWTKDRPYPIKIAEDSELTFDILEYSFLGAKRYLIVNVRPV